MATVAATGRSRASRARGSATPLAYLAAVAIIGGLVLPSALRPPPDEATTSAEFSPDAPPEDEAPDAIISSLRQAGSAGAGNPITEGAGPDVTALAPPTTLPQRAPRGKCIGNPALQTDSFYAAQCSPGWVGDNGGATAKGVTGNEFRVGVFIGDSDRAPEGPVRDQWSEPEEPDSHRHARVWQAYFNQRYEMYGRRLQMVLIKGPGTGDAEGRAAARRAAEDFGVFAMSAQSIVNAGALDELVRRKVVTWITTENPHDYYAKHHPYTYSFNMDADKVIAIASELICKQMAGKPPTFNEGRDLLFDYKAPRKFGLINYADETRYGNDVAFNKELGKCGAKLELTVTLNLHDNQQGASAAISRMRAADVTTVILGTDPITPVVFTNEATNSNYWPEWFNTGSAGLHDNGTGQLYHQEQWKHSVGVFYPEMPRPSIEHDYYRAYKSIEPGESPGQAGLFRELQMIANGVQGAGPKLTPETFWQGLQKMPKRPPSPVWSIGGGFGPNDYTYSDYMSVSWWDPEAQDPEEDLPGAYRWLWGGKRFKAGEIPSEPIPFFTAAEGSVTAAEAEAYWAQRGGGG